MDNAHIAVPNPARREVSPFDLAGDVAVKLGNGGILLNSRAGDEFDSMVIGWGTMGRLWNLPYFIAYVRESRHTRKLIEASGAFTVSVPATRLDPQIFKVCGSMSGRDLDKVQAAGLTLAEPLENGVPALMQAPITLECRVTYTVMQDVAPMTEEIAQTWYPQSAPSPLPEANRDRHFAYYGQILHAYVIE